MLFYLLNCTEDFPFEMVTKSIWQLVKCWGFFSFSFSFFFFLGKSMYWSSWYGFKMKFAMPCPHLLYEKGSPRLSKNTEQWESTISKRKGSRIMHTSTIISMGNKVKWVWPNDMIITKGNRDPLNLMMSFGDIHSLLTSTHYSSEHYFAHTNGFGRFFSILLALKLRQREAD